MPKTKALHSDFGTPERKRHGPYEIEAVPKEKEDTTNRDRICMIEVDDPLWQARHRRQITARERDAGYKLRELRVACNMDPCVISPYRERIGNGTLPCPQVISLENERKYKAALKILTPNVRQCVIRVCCHGEGLGYGQIKHLKHGLRKLQRFFGV